MANLDTTGLYRKSSAALVVLLALAPLGLLSWQLANYFLSSNSPHGTLTLYDAEMFLIRLTLYLLVLAILSKRLTGTTLTIALWSAALMSQYDHLKAYLTSSPLPAASQPIAEHVTLFIDPAPILYAILALITLLFMLLFKRLRSLDRWYVASIAAFVLATTSIFHVTLQTGLQDILQDYPTLTAHEPAKHTPLATRALALDTETRQHQLLYANRAPEPSRAAISTDARLTERFRAMFATLSIPVHAAWILASLLGLVWHKRALARRQREQRTIDDYVEKRFYEFING